MSRPNPPALTVRYDGSTRTFAPGNDVVVGRDLRADVRIAHPLISRAHLVLRFDQGRWVGIDNGSLNGLYVNGRRVPAVDIADGQQVNIGSPDGPGLTFEVGRHQGSAGTPPQTTSVPLASRPSPSIPEPAATTTAYVAPAYPASGRRPPEAAGVSVRTAAAIPVGSAGLPQRPVVVFAEHVAARPANSGGAADLLPRSGISHADGSDGRAAHE